MPELKMDRGVKSDPPEGKRRVKNIYWDPDTQEIVVDYEEEGGE